MVKFQNTLVFTYILRSAVLDRHLRSWHEATLWNLLFLTCKLVLFCLWKLFHIKGQNIVDIDLLAGAPDYFLYLDQLFFIVQVDRIFVCEPSMQIVSERVGDSRPLDQHVFHFSLQYFFSISHVIIIKVQLCLTVLHISYPSTSFHQVYHKEENRHFG